MLNRYYNSSDERLLKEKSEVMFEEVSGGVYHVKKDRQELYPNYVHSHDVARALNSSRKTSVTGSRGLFSNFELNM